MISAARFLSALLVAADEDVLVGFWPGRASAAAATVCSALTTRTPAGAISCGLLGGGALPHPEHARRPAGHGGGERHRRVDQELALAQRAP